MWLGELITDRGVGNGMSVLIFTTVISQMAGYMVDVYHVKGVFVLAIVLLVGVGIVAFVVFMNRPSAASRCSTPSGWWAARCTAGPPPTFR